MPRCFNVSRPLIANMGFFVNISNYFKCEIYASWHLAQHVGILEMIDLHFSVQGEDINKHTTRKCHGVLNYIMQEEDS